MSDQIEEEEQHQKIWEQQTPFKTKDNWSKYKGQHMMVNYEEHTSYIYIPLRNHNDNTTMSSKDQHNKQPSGMLKEC